MCGKVPGVDGSIEDHAACLALYYSCRSGAEDSAVLSPPPDFFCETSGAALPSGPEQRESSIRTPCLPESSHPPFKIPIVRLLAA